MSAHQVRPQTINLEQPTEVAARTLPRPEYRNRSFGLRVFIRVEENGEVLCAFLCQQFARTIVGIRDAKSSLRCVRR